MLFVIAFNCELEMHDAFMHLLLFSIDSHEKKGMHQRENICMFLNDTGMEEAALENVYVFCVYSGTALTFRRILHVYFLYITDIYFSPK